MSLPDLCYKRRLFHYIILHLQKFTQKPIFKNSIPEKRMEDGEYGLNELFAELSLEKPPETMEEEEVDDGGPHELTEKEAEEMFAMLAQVLKEEKEEKKAGELAKWLVKWKVLIDEAEEMLKALGYKDEIIHAKCFEEIMFREEIDFEEEIEFM